MTFTREQIRQLAEMDRRMDRGEVPFVRANGERMAVHPRCMEEFGLEQGQTISSAIVMEIVSWNLAEAVAALEESKFQDGRFGSFAGLRFVK